MTNYCYRGFTASVCALLLLIAFVANAPAQKKSRLQDDSRLAIFLRRVDRQHPHVLRQREPGDNECNQNQKCPETPHVPVTLLRC